MSEDILMSEKPAFNTFDFAVNAGFIKTGKGRIYRKWKITPEYNKHLQAILREHRRKSKIYREDKN